MIAADIEYNESSEGQTIVFLHGIGGNLDSFATQMAGLKNFRSIALNLPGYGQSSRGKWPPSFESLSARLSDFIKALQLGSVHLVGHSIGGMLAIEHSVRNPKQVRSLSLIGTTPSFGGRDQSFREQFLKARLAPLDAGQSMAEMASHAVPHLLGPDAKRDVIVKVQSQLASVTEETWRSILQCLVTFNRRDDLDKIAAPCCIIAGNCDQNAPAKTMEKMADNLPNAQFHVLEDVGHMINQEAPGVVNAILEDFLGELQK